MLDVHTSPAQAGESAESDTVSAPRTHNTARLPLRIPQELLDELDAHVADRSESRSDFVRRAIALQINRDQIHDKCLRARAALDDLGDQWTRPKPDQE